VKVVYITLIEPEKLDVLKFLGIPTSVEELGKAQPDTSIIIPRRAESAVIDAVTGTGYVVKLSIDSQNAVVDAVEMLPRGVEPGITMEELCEAEETVRNDPRVQKLCADIGVKPEEIAADGWSVGYEDRFPGRRLQQCFMYQRKSQHDNLYARPLDFNVVVDSNTNEVVHIDMAPHRLKGGSKLSSASTRPVADLAQDPLEASGRQRIPPAETSWDYLPDLLAQKEGGFPMRQDVKPLHIVQPEGVSFSMNGNRLQWQKWDMHISGHYREGIVFNTITYSDNGVVRPVFYRLSLAEMVVPYAAPEWPHPRKFAFDVGEYGMGVLANSLALGCDCLGEIHYKDLVFCNHAGEPVVIKNGICIHEEDAGILWKHSDFRPGGRAHAVRSRKLVVNMVCTVANYEYILQFNFFQDGTIQSEIKLTGILNLYTMAEGEDAGKYGTEVAPRVMAHHHQHLFSMRVDPMIDGLNNSVCEVDVVPTNAPTGSDENFAGNAFETRKTIFETTADGVRDADPVKGRTWLMINENKKHHASKLPVGYKIMCKDMPPLLAKPDSLVAMRAPFAKHNLWVAPYAAEQLYPAGKFVPQTMKTPDDAIDAFVAGGRNIRNTDIALWLTWGATHVPRPEDGPVMPVEIVHLTFKPSSFFDQNPALDVPQAADQKSKRAFADNQAGVVNTNGSNGKSCCA